MGRAAEKNLFSGPLRLHYDKPPSNDWALWAAATAAFFRSRRWGRRSGTTLWLEEVDVMGLWINRDCLRARKGVHGRHNCVFVGRVLMNHGDVTLASIRNVNQLFRGIPSQRVNSGTVLDGRNDFARSGIQDDGGVDATGENPVRRFIVRDTRRAFAWIELAMKRLPFTS